MDTEERCRSAEALLRRRFGEKFHYMVLKSPRYTRWFLDIISPASGKGKTLMELAGLLNVQRDETAAVGDDVNDIDMFHAAGVSVAMGNATQAVQDAADFVAPTNDQDGAAEAIMGLLEGRYGKS